MMKKHSKTPRIFRPGFDVLGNEKPKRNYPKIKYP
jgi:hypothetical protein